MHSKTVQTATTNSNKGFHYGKKIVKKEKSFLILPKSTINNKRILVFSYNFLACAYNCSVYVYVCALPLCFNGYMVFLKCSWGWKRVPVSLN